MLYSFGVANPGAITVHNYPNFLRELMRPDGEVIDLASIDIMRDRERGVPRYNRFRELLHKKPIRLVRRPGQPAASRPARGIARASTGRPTAATTSIAST